MHRFALIALVWLATAAPACAGAWLREAGDRFVSLTATTRSGPVGSGLESGLYAEYGMRPGLTAGLDLNDRDAVAGHALGFLRLPLGPSATPLRAAIELAAGAHHRGGSWRPMLRLTASAGRGFPTRWGHAWVNLDAGYEQRAGTGSPALKLDAALGLSDGPRWRPLVQLETYHRPGGRRYWTVAASLMIDAGHDQTWVIGLEHKSRPDDSTGLRIALWRRF